MIYDWISTVFCFTLVYLPFMSCMHLLSMFFAKHPKFFCLLPLKNYYRNRFNFKQLLEMAILFGWILFDFLWLQCPFVCYKYKSFIIGRWLNNFIFLFFFCGGWGEGRMGLCILVQFESHYCAHAEICGRIVPFLF